MQKTPTPEEMLKLTKEGVLEDAELGLVVDVIGYENNKKTIIKNYIIFPALKEIQKRMPGSTYISYPTGIAASSFIKIIPEIKKTGVLPPECLERDTRKKVFLELESHSISIHKEYKSVEN